MSAAAQAAPAGSSKRTPSVTQPVAELGWDELATRAPQLAATMQSYLNRYRCRHEPRPWGRRRWRCGISPRT